jgi:hypothetical protein
MKNNYFRIAFYLLVIIGLVSVSLLFPVGAKETINVNPIADSYVDSDSPTTNFGAGASVMVANFDAIEIRYNTYLLFNLTSFYKEIFAITSANLELYTSFDSSPTFQVGVHSCQDTEWNEIEITWENAPTFSAEPIDVETIAFGDTWYSWNVTNEVENAQEGYLTLVLKDESEETPGVVFSSKDSYDKHPRLVIEYEAIAEPEPPEASFAYSPLDPQVNDTINFDASDSNDIDGTIVSYLWDFGDGDTSTGQNPTHAYDQEGSYTVTLTVTDDDGLTDTTSVTIAEVVIPEFSSYSLLLVSLTIVTVALVIYKRKIKKAFTKQHLECK